MTLVYKASGSGDGDFVRTFAAAGSPAVWSHERGLLYRQDVRVDPAGFEQWRVTVPYGPRKAEQGDWTFDFDTSGGTLHITNSLQTVQRYAAAGKPAAPDMGGAIGVRGDQIDGVEIVIPALKLNVGYKHPAGVITLAQAKLLARNTGKVNSARFLTFDAGEVLFLGAAGSDGTDAPAEVKYQFACSENIASRAIGPVAGVAKKGWEHAWVRYEDAVEAGPPAVPKKLPVWVYVERVYETVDLAALLGFGG